MKRLYFPILVILLAVSLLLAYSNHFENDFHFDDSHSVVSNVFIRDIKNIPLFFGDATTFGSLPSNQMYRPIVTASLAIDYWLGGGLNPFYFHLSTFCWYFVQLLLMWFFFWKVFNLVRPSSRNRFVALFAVSIYGLHPVSAETVNYVIQRGDLYSTLWTVAAFIVFIFFPAKRRFGLYLIPVVIGTLAKPPTIMFAPMLFCYLLLFEDTNWRAKFLFPRWGDVKAAGIKSAPSFIICAALYVFQGKMSPATFTPGGTSLFRYLITQPFVTFYYFKSFFLPTELSADSDWDLFSSPFSTEAVAGYIFVAGLFYLTMLTMRSKKYAPVCFGLIWFVLALVPTAVTPLAEVVNDHRMFFPFVGLTMSIVWGVEEWISSRSGSSITELLKRAVVLCGVLALPAFAYGTFKRNQVWHTEESLWYDVTEKSPRNGRGLMNYGLTKMEKGDYQTALNYFERAHFYTPNYPILEINLGIAKGALGRSEEAEKHFLRAISLPSSDPARGYFFYARWLKNQGRIDESIQKLIQAVRLNPNFFDSRYLLMELYLQKGEHQKLNDLVNDTLRLSPQDPTALAYLRGMQNGAPAKKTPEDLLNDSLAKFNEHDYAGSISAAKEALSMRPDFAEAYNNICAAYTALGRFDDAIKAGKQALSIRPDYQLAANNVKYAEDLKAGKISQPTK